jgi:hypothetical protein
VSHTVGRLEFRQSHQGQPRMKLLLRLGKYPREFDSKNATISALLCCPCALIGPPLEELGMLTQ